MRSFPPGGVTTQASRISATSKHSSGMSSIRATALSPSAVAVMRERYQILSPRENLVFLPATVQFMLALSETVSAKLSVVTPTSARDSANPICSHRGSMSRSQPYAGVLRMFGRAGSARPIPPPHPHHRRRQFRFPDRNRRRCRCPASYLLGRIGKNLCACSCWI